MSVNIRSASALAAALLCVAPLAAQKIGKRFTISSSGDVARGDVAYASRAGIYVAAWQRNYLGSQQIRARRIRQDGTFAGVDISVASGAGQRSQPRVAYVAKTRTCLIVWQERPSAVKPWKILGRTFNPFTGAMSATTTLVSHSNGVVEPDVGGNAGASHDRAILVYRLQGLGLRSKPVGVPSVGTPIKINVAYVVSSNKNDQKPTISRSGGTKQRFVMSWRRDMIIYDDVYARALSDIAVPKGNEIAVSMGKQIEGSPEIDGNGEHFMVAWPRTEVWGKPARNIYCRVLRNDGSKVMLDGPITPVATYKDLDDRDPCVGHTGNKFLVGYSHSAPSANNHDIHVVSYAPDKAVRCGGKVAIQGSNRKDVYPAMGTAFSSASGSDRALLTFVSEDPAKAFKGKLEGQLLAGMGPGGVISNLGGGCGKGGSATTFGAFSVGNNDFRVRLSGGEKKSPATLLNLTAIGPAFLNCGPCAIARPMLILPAGSGGAGSVALPLPCDNKLLGLGLQFQFYVLASGTSPCGAIDGMSFSNRLAGKISH